MARELVEELEGVDEAAGGDREEEEEERPNNFLPSLLLSTNNRMSGHVVVFLGQEIGRKKPEESPPRPIRP